MPQGPVTYPHRIRLRGPWECEPLARALPAVGGQVEMPGGALPAPRRMTMPCRWGEGGLGDFAGRVRFRRRFGWPGRIDPHERVWLTFAGVEGVADVWLNGHLLGRHEHSPGPFEFEVPARLLEFRNELVVEVEAAGGSGGLWGEVALEVRCSAFLRGVRAWAERAGEGFRVHAAGEVAGTAERPLELYLLLDGKTAGYTVIEAAAEGKLFDLTAEMPAEGNAGERVVRVELVNGAVVWYTAEPPLVDEQGEGTGTQTAHDQQGGPS